MPFSPLFADNITWFEINYLQLAGELLDAGVNRSPSAYLNNPAAERGKWHNSWTIWLPTSALGRNHIDSFKIITSKFLIQLMMPGKVKVGKHYIPEEKGQACLIHLFLDSWCNLLLAVFHLFLTCFNSMQNYHNYNNLHITFKLSTWAHICI